MKKLLLLLFTALFIMNFSAKAQSILPGYNGTLYSNVLNATVGVGKPFLLQQGYLTMPGVTILNDTTLSYQGHKYFLHNKYQNTAPPDTVNYYIPDSLYTIYGVNIFKNVWPTRIPNVLFKSSDSTFYSLVDCVGYGTRLLSAVGDTSTMGNAYMNLMHTIWNERKTVFCARGYVAMAYEVAAAFPTLLDVNPTGWIYVSGNIIADSINAFNHRREPTIGTYNGRIKGGFNLSQAGDILAFGYGPGGTDNGHFMVISQQPYRLNYDSIHRLYPNVSTANVNAFLSTYNVYATPLFDCSGKHAHFYDSRTFSSGIGHGTLLMLTNPSNDVPQGFIFSRPYDTATVIVKELMSDAHTWAITVGRFNPGTIGINETGINLVPTKPQLGQNYPNPFNPVTKIKFSIPNNSGVSLVVYDVTGKEVVKLLNNYTLNRGNYEYTFNGSDLSSGLYFYSLYVNGVRISTNKMVLVK
jgi:hypothetical protein